MKRTQVLRTLAAVAGALGLASVFLGAYSYYESDNLTSINSAKWYQNGSVAAGTGGLTG